jgi:hypothetical protein
MLTQLKHISYWTTLTLCGLILATLLIGCGATGGTSTTPTPTPKPTPSPTPSPTPIPKATLTGNGFTINYPQSWHVTRSGSHLVTFVDSTGTLKMSISTVPDPNETVSAASLSSAGLKAATVALKNAQPVSVPSTTMVGGETWNQGAVAGTQRLNNQDIMIQTVVLANVYPAKAIASKGYTINYSATQPMFNQANTTYFQPMLQSFKFV